MLKGKRCAFGGHFCVPYLKLGWVILSCSLLLDILKMLYCAMVFVAIQIAIHFYRNSHNRVLKLFVVVTKQFQLSRKLSVYIETPGYSQITTPVVIISYAEYLTKSGRLKCRHWDFA